MTTPEFLHYGAAAISISLGALGAGIGLGIAGLGVQEAMSRQPMGSLQSFRAMIIGLAIIESGIIVTLVITLLTLLYGGKNITWEVAFVELGIGLSIAIAAAVTSIASSFVVKASAQSIARQPLFAGKIITFMLISQSIIEAPVIFVFIVNLLTRAQLSPTLHIGASLRLFASTLAVGAGCIGPSIGQAIFAHAACDSIGRNKDAYSKLFPFSLLTEAIIEGPIIFCLLLSLMMLYNQSVDSTSMTSCLKYIAAALTVALGAFGSAIGIGHVGAKVCKQITLEPNVYTLIARSTLLTIAFVESSMIYALIIAMFLILRN